MNRSQRARHHILWWVLAPLLIVLFLLATLGRQQYPDQPRPSGSAGESGEGGR